MPPPFSMASMSAPAFRGDDVAGGGGGGGGGIPGGAPFPALVGVAFAGARAPPLPLAGAGDAPLPSRASAKELSFRRALKKFSSLASAAAVSNARCAAAAAVAPAPSKGGCAAPPGVSSQIGIDECVPSAPSTSTTRDTFKAPCARSWSRIPLVLVPTLNTKTPSGRSSPVEA